MCSEESASAKEMFSNPAASETNEPDFVWVPHTAQAFSCRAHLAEFRRQQFHTIVCRRFWDRGAHNLIRDSAGTRSCLIDQLSMSSFAFCVHFVANRADNQNTHVHSIESCFSVKALDPKAIVEVHMTWVAHCGDTETDVVRPPVLVMASEASPPRVAAPFGEVAPLTTTIFLKKNF